MIFQTDKEHFFMIMILRKKGKIRLKKPPIRFKWNKKITVNKITLSYLIGYFMADGGFIMTLNKSTGTVDATIRISSKTNKNILKLLSRFIKSTLKINCTQDPESSGRAPCLRIQGVLQVQKMIALITKHSAILKIGKRNIALFGSKYRTMLLVKYIIENRASLNKSRAIQIDLIKSMHKTFRNEPDLFLGGSHTLTRNDLELRYGIPANSSN